MKRARVLALVTVLALSAALLYAADIPYEFTEINNTGVYFPWLADVDLEIYELDYGIEGVRGSAEPEYAARMSGFVISFPDGLPEEVSEADFLKAFATEAFPEFGRSSIFLMSSELGGIRTALEEKTVADNPAMFSQYDLNTVKDVRMSGTSGVFIEDGRVNYMVIMGGPGKKEKDLQEFFIGKFFEQGKDNK